MRAVEFLKENKIKLYTDPNYYGAMVGNYKASGPVVNVPTNNLVGFEPDKKMGLPNSKANVERIIAGLEKGDKLPPILVRKYGNSYQVVDGHHRFWAYKLLNKDNIPAQIVPDKDIEEVGKVSEDEETSKNLAWRIRFRRFKDMDPLLPEREGKMYFMPMDHSAVRTFTNLTGKDHYKIGNMPTEVYEIPHDAMVYDMKIVNSINNARNYAYNERNPERKKQYEKMIDYHKKQYISTGVPYSQYQPGMFDYPEILVEPGKVRKLVDKGVAYDKNTGQMKLTQR